jgi:ABC-type bacteriocin/lantibiotic exporter with double-glycine peptidase domain
MSDWTMPKTLFGYIWRVSRRHQVGLCLLSITVFLLSAVPLELQRRIVNDAIVKGALDTIVWLAIAYAAVSLAEGAVKLWLNIYRSWVSERAVRDLRHRVGALTAEAGVISGGVEISMILTESEPIGGFIGMSISEPLLQGGVLLSVFGYLVWLHPMMALLSIAVFAPQMVFVPLMQQAMNRRASERIQTLREVSDGIAGASGRDAAHAAAQDVQVDHVFRLNMGIFKLKFTMNFLMNLIHHLGVATVLGVGGWYAAQGRIEVGTVVAFISGLAKVNDPWRDVVAWYREMTAVEMRYRMVADAMRGPGPDRNTPAERLGSLLVNRR